MAKKKQTKQKKEKRIIKKPLTVKKKKKRWASIITTKNFFGIEIGETLISDIENLRGKRISSSLLSLGKGKNPSIKVMFEVNNIVDGNGVAEAVGYYILNSYSRRIVKKGRTKIYKSYRLKTKDDLDVILKLALITRNKVTGGTEKDIKRELDNFIKDEINKNSFNITLNNIIEYKLQSKIKEYLKKIYPVASLEVLIFRRI